MTARRPLTTVHRATARSLRRFFRPRRKSPTGTVSGTIKDAQGGVVPGATIALVSQTRGTKMAPVVTIPRATSSSPISLPTPTPFR